MTTIVVQEQKQFFYNPSKCTRCGNCLEVCGFDVWEIPDSGPAVVARPDNCTNCTACAKNCLGQAIMVTNFGCGCVWNQAGKQSDDPCCEQDVSVGGTESSCCG